MKCQLKEMETLVTDDNFIQIFAPPAWPMRDLTHN